MDRGLHIGRRPGLKAGLEHGLNPGRFHVTNVCVSDRLDPVTRQWLNHPNVLTPSRYYVQQLDNLIYQCRIDNNLQYLDRFLIFAQEQNNKINGLVSIVNGGGRDTAWPTNAVEVNSPTWSALKGYTGNGTSSYIDTNYIAANSNLVTGTNISYGYYARLAISQTTGREMGNLSSTAQTFLRGWDGTGSRLSLNDAAGQAFTGATSGQGMFTMARLTSVPGNATLYYRGNAVRTLADGYAGDSSAGPNNRNIYLLAANWGASNSATDFSTQQLSCFYAGTGDVNHLKLYNAWQTFATALGFNV